MLEPRELSAEDRELLSYRRVKFARGVVSPMIGDNPRYTCRSGGFDELSVSLGRGKGGECDDEGILPFQSGNKRIFIGVVD